MIKSFMPVYNDKITIITVAYNSEKTIEDTICSVLSQTYPNIEYIIVDGASKDGTLAIVNRYRSRTAKIISESDKGIYDAMNKGIGLATGDIVGFLHSDDVYFNNDAIADIAQTFQEKNTDSVFGDMVYVNRYNTEKIIRYYRADDFSTDRFAFGWMPPHPTFFVKRQFYQKYGVFQDDYRIAADFELLVRFLSTYSITYTYIPKTLVKMRVGGTSTRSLASTLILNKEILRACAENNIKTNYFNVYSKYLTKVFQLINRPK
ncbi:MAG: glycosyltransferase [Nitrospiraceae bacterium]|nr:glycosyltransferase [Nitrospiraceae bacterium]